MLLLDALPFVRQQRLRIRHGRLRRVGRELVREGERGGEDVVSCGEDGVVEAGEEGGGRVEGPAGEEEGGGFGVAEETGEDVG